MLAAESRMPTGLAKPSKIVHGKLTLSSGAVQLGKIIMIAAGPQENTNPWNTAGSRARPFVLNDRYTQLEYRQDIERHFRRLERESRARLIDLTFRQEDDVLYVDLEYLDIVRQKKVVSTVTVDTFLGGTS
jgi:hypothetical protein